MYRTIVAGCNGYERGRGAVSLAHAVASATGARLVLVGVHHNPPLPYPDGYAEQRAGLQHALTAVRDELAPKAIVQVRADLSPARALRHVAEAERADLLVLGSRRWGPVRRLALGSTSERVIRHTACPVLVPPRDGASEHGDAESVSDETVLG